MDWHAKVQTIEVDQKPRLIDQLQSEQGHSRMWVPSEMCKTCEKKSEPRKTM